MTSLPTRTLGALCAALAVGTAWVDDIDIVGGQPAPDGRYPAMVGLVQKRIAIDHRAFACGATLVSPRDVLTAAHCLDYYSNPPIDLQVLVGTTQLSQTSQSAGRRVAIARATIHPLRKRGIMNYDVAVLRLAEPVTAIRPMPFVDTKAKEKRVAPDGKNVTVTGWGSTIPVYFEPGNISPVLKEATVTMVNWTECDQSIYYKEYLTKNMVCAGWAAGGQDTCPGDSGGPLLAADPKAPGGFTQVGITSWSPTTCGEVGYPGVYARLATLGPWVREQIALP